MSEPIRWAMQRRERRIGVWFPNNGPDGTERRERGLPLPGNGLGGTILVGDREREKFEAEGYGVVRELNPPCPHCGRRPKSE